MKKRQIIVVPDEIAEEPYESGQQIAVRAFETLMAFLPIVARKGSPTEGLEDADALCKELGVNGLVARTAEIKFAVTGMIKLAEYLMAAASDIVERGDEPRPTEETVAAWAEVDKLTRTAVYAGGEDA